MQVDHDDVFWFESGDLSVRKVSKLGGSPVILASGQPAPVTTRASPGLVALDDVHVYWASQSSVLRVRKDGTGQVELVATPATSPSVFRLDASDVYWVETFTIFRIAKAGGAVQSKTPEGVFGDELTQLGFDDTYVYFNFAAPFGFGASSQGRMSKDFISAASPLPGVADRGGALFDGSTVYVVSGVQLCTAGTTHQLNQLPFGVGGVRGTMAVGISCFFDDVAPLAMFVDDTYLYWNDTLDSPGGLQQILKCGAGMTPVTLGPAITPTFDESYVYWSTGSTIMRGSK